MNDQIVTKQEIEQLITDSQRGFSHPDIIWGTQTYISEIYTRNNQPRCRACELGLVKVGQMYNEYDPSNRDAILKISDAARRLEDELERPFVVPEKYKEQLLSHRFRSDINKRFSVAITIFNDHFATSHADVVQFLKDCAEVAPEA